MTIDIVNIHSHLTQRTLIIYTSRNRENSSSVTMIIYQEGASDKPHQITNVDQFKNKPFDDLWQEAITPKFKLGRSYKDNPEGSHIG